ncbi:MAG: DUF5606 domain-containing protein [Bacteroidota bacterium]
MNLEKIVAISGNTVNGLFEMIANRSNGLVVEDLETKKRRFVASRRHNFTPLSSVGIYTDDGDAADIKVVFEKMKEQEADNPPVAPNSKEEELREYFADVLPTYDKDRVYTRDIKRVIKWYNALKKNGLLEEQAEENQTEENVAETSSEEAENAAG